MRAVVRIAVVMGVVWGASARGQDEAVPPVPPADWVVARLGALEPRDPAAYLLLGEELVTEAQTRDDEELARHLFALAYELDRRDGTPTWVAPSGCLALASMARLESDRRWLRALANRLDPGYRAPVWREATAESSVGQVAFDAAEAIGSVRAGDGARARDLLDEPGVRELILRYGQLLGFSAATGALWQIEQWASEWPCRECGNERVVFRPNTDPPSYRECYTCRGNPGPRLSEAQVVSALRFESRLLHGISRSWSAQLAIDYGAPLRDPAPDELVSVLGIDPGLPYWRGGAWVASPDTEPEAGATVGEGAPGVGDAPSEEPKP